MKAKMTVIILTYNRAEMLNRQADELQAKARLIDAQQSSPRTFEDYSLMEARL